MTVLQHEALWDAIKRPDLEQRLVVTPLLDETQVGPSSIDVRLGTEFRLFRRTREAGIDPGGHTEKALEETYERVIVSLGEGLWLHPGQFILGATLEYLHLPPDVSGYVIGRSSWGRIGLIVATAILVHPGYTGCLTLELANDGDSPIKLYPGVRIAQLALHSLHKPTDHLYGAGSDKYLAPTGPQVTRLAKEQREVDQIKQLGKCLNIFDPATDEGS